MTDENKPSLPPAESEAGRTSSSSSDVTIPERPPSTAIRRAIDVITRGAALESVLPESERHKLRSTDTPWALEQFFNGEIDLDAELAQRFPNMPLMSVISFRSMGNKNQRGVATISAQDGAAQMVIDVDSTSKITQASFTFGSMLTLRFRLDGLSDVDRTRWLELMRREQGGLAFLWGAARWEQDYVICVVRRYFSNFYAFSPRGYEAAIRMTPDVTKQLMGWLAGFWKPAPPAESDSSKLLTW